MTHYEALGVKPEATPEEIKAAYRRCSSTAHPDREGGSVERMQAVNRAYDVLSDPAKRAQYDRTGSDQPGDTPEKMAEKLLTDAFDRAIESDAEPVLFTRQHIGKTIAHLAEVKAKTTRERTRLEKRLGRTKTKAGARNLVQELLERKIAAKTVTINECTAALEACSIAADALENYIADAEHTPPDTRTELQKKQQMFAEMASQFTYARTPT